MSSSSQPAIVGGVPVITTYTNYAANQTILTTNFKANANGSIVVAFTVSPGAVPQITRNGFTANMNSGNALNAGAEYVFKSPVQTGETVNYSFATGTSLGMIRALFNEGL